MDETDGACVGKLKNSLCKKTNLKDNLEVGQVGDTITNNNNNEESLLRMEGSATAPTILTDLSYYKMDHQYRGLLIIFNHEKYEKETKLNGQPRLGTDKDVEKIRSAFKAIGFEVHMFKDMLLHEIRQQIDLYVKSQHYHRLRDCFAIFVLTHGDQNLLWARDACYDPADVIWSKLTGDKCPALAACQGDKLDPGVKLIFPRSPRTEVDGGFFQEIPVCADFLLCYATYPGYYAFRNERKGSYWVTVLCEELVKRYVHTDIMHILTMVNNRMGIEFSSYNSDKVKNNKRQISYFSSSLTKILVFGQKMRT
ncbi:caspase-1-like isoform X2 [Euwallacea fornicatus]|uniref:caspase-1-like isoform X2 n=1 Tax=Euwallacea fornicatus TaxID=995702 RepID=UPI00338E8896